MKHAVYHHLNAAGQALYVGCSCNPPQRTALHASVTPWFHEVTEIKVKWYDTKEEGLAAESKEIARLTPPHNVQDNPRREKKKTPKEGYLFLADWFSFSGVSHADFAKHIGITKEYAERLSSYPYCNPRMKRELDITFATGGYVPKSAFGWSSKFTGRLTEKQALAEVEEARSLLAAWRKLGSEYPELTPMFTPETQALEVPQ